METPNQNPKVDTLTLQLKQSIEFELLKRENRQLKQEVARLKQELKRTRDSEAFFKIFKSTDSPTGLKTSV